MEFPVEMDAAYQNPQVIDRDANFCLFLVLKNADVGGRGVQKSQKCDDVIYEWSHNDLANIFGECNLHSFDSLSN